MVAYPLDHELVCGHTKNACAQQARVQNLMTSLIAGHNKNINFSWQKIVENNVSNVKGYDFVYELPWEHRELRFELIMQRIFQSKFRKQRGKDETAETYFLAGRSMMWWAVS